jgi:hypothetical protein
LAYVIRLSIKLYVVWKTCIGGCRDVVNKELSAADSPPIKRNTTEKVKRYHNIK